MPGTLELRHYHLLGGASVRLIFNDVIPCGKTIANRRLGIQKLNKILVVLEIISFAYQYVLNY